MHFPKSGATRRCKACFATTRRTAFLAVIAQAVKSGNPALKGQEILTLTPVSDRGKLTRCRITPELTGPALGRFRSRYYRDATEAASHDAGSG